MPYDLSEIGLDQFESRKGPDRKWVYYAVLKLKMSLEGESLSAEVWWKDTLLAREGPIRYPQY